MASTIEPRNVRVADSATSALNPAFLDVMLYLALGAFGLWSLVQLWHFYGLHR